MQNPKTRGLCPKCLYIRPLTKHHIYPVRHYGGGDRAPVIFLCRQCHDLIEARIPFHRIPRQDLLQITREFLGEDWK